MTINRPYTQEQVELLRGSMKIEYTIAKTMANKLRNLLENNEYINALGCINGGQAVECAKAGLQALYISGWQVAADANDAAEVYPDQSLYPSHSVPMLVRKLNKALQRADQIEWSETNGNPVVDYWLPQIADCEAAFGGNLNAFEMTKWMIEAGIAGMHLEDQLSSAKKCGHLGAKVLVPTSEFVQKLIAARLASDVCEVPIIIVARTDANSAQYLTSDIDAIDREFVKNSIRTPEGFYSITGGIEMAINRGLSYAPYADMLWCETSTPDLKEAKYFAESIHAKFPNKWLAYNCSPSFNWRQHLSKEEIADFQKELGKLGYKYQFVTLAGWHSLNNDMFALARGYKETGMAAYSELQEREFANQIHGYTAVKHQREVGTGYFDKVAETISGGTSSTLAMKNSTEEHQF